MAIAEAPAVNACDVLATLHQTAIELNAWIGHVEAYLSSSQPGHAYAAARSAGIVAATLEAAACDSRAVARAAAEAAFLDAA